MSKKYITDNIKIDGQLLDGSGGAGTSGQVLSSTGSATSWVSGSGLPGGPYLPLSGGTLTGDLTLDDNSGASPSLYLKNGNNNFWRLFCGSSEDLTFRLGTVTKLEIDSSGNASFTGNVTLNSRLTFDYGGDHYFEAGTNSLSYKSSGGTSVMTLNASTQAATFAGDVTLSAGNIIFGSQYGVRFNDANTRIYTNVETPEDLIVEADQDLLLQPDGNVGIGTTSPSKKLHVNGTSQFDSDVYQYGVNYGLYHGTIEDDYYFDDYNGSRYLSLFYKNAYSDILRYQPIDNLEYWDGSAWQDMSSQAANVKKLLDGRKDTSWYVPSTYYKFRFTTSLATSWPTRSMVWLESSWTGSTYPGGTVTIEEDVSGTWTTRITADFDSGNGVTNWGLAARADSALHTGVGSAANSTRITVDFYGWSPSNPSYTTIPLQNIMITSQFSGGANTDYSALLNYDKTLTAPAKLYITTTDTNTTSTSALVLNGNEVEKRTLGSNAFNSTNFWHSGNDGSGSELDADLLDGVQGSSYLRSDTADTATGAITFSGQVNLNSTVRLDPNGTNFEIDTDSTDRVIFSFNKNGTRNWSLRAEGGNLNFYRDSGSGSIQINNNRILTTADEGSGNGLDADTLDGNHASAFLTGYTETDTLATVTGRGSSTTTSCTFNTITMNTPVVGSSNKIKFANNDYIRYDDTNGAGRFHFDADGGTNNASVQAATFVGALSTTGISGNNYNITGVNQLEINDPGEGIIWKGGSSGDITLAVVDDASDNILRLSGTGATLQVGTNRVLTTADEGSGNGLDADTLDGNHASAFASSSHNHDSDYVNVSGDTMTGNLTLNDNVELRLGTSSDFKAGHTGAYTYLYNYTGHMYLRNFADDSDIIFQTDDGSGGYTTYFNLDGSTGHAYFSNPGNVGIGETNPAYPLDVSGTVKASALRVSASDPGVQFEDSAGSTYEGLLRYRDNALEWLWGGGIKLRVSSDGGMAISQGYSTSSIPTSGLILPGKVGIGTDSPVRDLQIKKSTSGGQVRAEVFNASNTANSHGVLSIYSGGSSAGDPFLHWKVDAVQDWSMGIDNSDSDKLKISKNFGPGVNDYLTIATTGYVGIGTTSPGSPLSVYHATANKIATFVSGDNGGLIQISDNDTTSYVGSEGSLTYIGQTASASPNNLIINSSGSVGIGTTSPSYNLHILDGDPYIALNGTTSSDDISLLYHKGGTLNLIARYSSTVGGGVDIVSRNNTGDTDLANFENTGRLVLPQYGGGTFTGTATKMLAVDTNGNVIEETLPTGDITGVTAGTNLNGGGTSGTVTLNLDSSIDLTSVTTDELSYTYPTATGEFNGEIVTFGSFNGTIAAGDVIVYTTAGLQTGWFLAQGNTTYSKGMLGIAMGTSASDGVLIKGFARHASFASGSLGSPLYLSPTTAGDTTHTIPSSTNNIVRIVGYMLNPTNDEIFFDPDKSWVQVS